MMSYLDEILILKCFDNGLKYENCDFDIEFKKLVNNIANDNIEGIVFGMEVLYKSNRFDDALSLICLSKHVYVIDTIEKLCFL